MPLKSFMFNILKFTATKPAEMSILLENAHMSDHKQNRPTYILFIFSHNTRGIYFLAISSHHIDVSKIIFTKEDVTKEHTICS